MALCNFGQPARSLVTAHSFTTRRECRQQFRALHPVCRHRGHRIAACNRQGSTTAQGEHLLSPWPAVAVQGLSVVLAIICFLGQLTETHGVILGEKLGKTEELLLSGLAPATQVRYRDLIVDFERLVQDRLGHGEFKVTTHPLRRGRATELCRRGDGVEIIMIAGRWGVLELPPLPSASRRGTPQRTQ